MFETLSKVISALHNGIINGSDAAISSMCGLVWSGLFGWIAGIIIGFSFLAMLFDDDLVKGFRNLVITLLTLIVIAWFIKPNSSGCKVVQLKTDIIAFRAAATSAVAPEYSGSGGASDLVVKTTDRMSELMDKFFDNSMKALKQQDTAEQITSRDPLITGE